MSLHARQTLADCEAAHELLKKEKKDSPTWRVHWVACLTLLRAVGHVLDKADGDTGEKHRAVIKAKWEEWKADKDANAIFWNFVEEERNNLLKEYKFGVEPEPTYIVTQNGDMIVTEQDELIITEDEFFRLSHVGFEDQEGRNVIGLAIEWWRKQLDEIEAQLTSDPRGTVEPDKSRPDHAKQRPPHAEESPKDTLGRGG